MNLKVKDRLLLMSILPAEGSLADMLIIRMLVEKVGLTAEDHEAVKLRTGETAGTVVWDEDKDVGKEIEFLGPETTLIVTALQKLDSEKKLTPNHIELCAMFGVGGTA